MSRIREEAEKLIEDFAKAQLRCLRKVNSKIPLTEEQLFQIGRTYALVAVTRSLKKLRIKKKRIKDFGYQWQLDELIKREKSILNYLKVNYATSPPKEF